jgi:uncharacterized protein (TIGR03086 family)
MTTTQMDPRPLYDTALRWVQSLLDGVEPEQMTLPTPCTEFDMRTLAGHMLTGLARIRLVGAGADPFAVPLVTTGVPDDGLAKAYGEAVDALWQVWRGPDGDELLDRMLTLPFGTAPGRAAMGVYLNEALVHGWDLATATGQHSEADPEVAAVALEAARQRIPADRRGGPVPFAAPVEPAPDAGPTERLANWSGRASR